MMTSMTLQKSRFPVQHIFSTNSEFSKTLLPQSKTRQRVTLAGGVGNGERGIRTPGPVSRTQHFQCCTIGRSAISPKMVTLAFFHSIRDLPMLSQGRNA